MEQPLFSCAKCFKNFPQSEMSRSGQTCKNCNPHHSTFKQCEYCKSDFKYHIYGSICPRCQSLKAKYGDPQPCSICQLSTAFGNALVCQRCLHYRVRFGEPRECQACGQLCAFLKDEASRQKVDGQILCWVCTYNFKLARSREKSEHGNKRRPDDSNRLKSQSNFEAQLKRARSDDYGSLKADPVDSTAARATSTQSQSIDSVYNEHLLTISQLQDEVKALKRQLVAKDADMLSKDRLIAELRSEIIDMKSIYEDRMMKAKSFAQLEQDRLTSVIKQLQREKASLSQGLRKRKSGVNLTSASPALRYSSSSVALFNPDSPISVYSEKSKKKENASIVKQSQKQNSPIDDNGLMMNRSSERNEIVYIKRDGSAESGKKSSSNSNDEVDPSPSPEEMKNQETKLSTASSPDADSCNTEAEQVVDHPVTCNASAKDLFGLDSSSDSEEDTM